MWFGFFQSLEELLSVISISFWIRSEDPDCSHSSFYVTLVQEVGDFSAYISNTASGNWISPHKWCNQERLRFHHWTLMYADFFALCFYEQFV